MNHKLDLSFRETIVDHLVFFDENSTEIIDSYFLSDRSKFKEFYTTYTSEVEKFLTTLNTEGEVQDYIPKVFIGCKVLLNYIEDNEVEEYTICFPELSDPDNGFISFLSPVGSQLLLRSASEKMLLSTPGGELKVIIKEITF